MFYLNGKPLKVTIFPDQTSQVWNIPDEFFEKELGNHILWKFDSESEYLHLAQLKTLLNEIVPRSWIGLILPYLPYARQDKEIGNNSTFALHTFAKLLNYLNFNDVLISDPHSKVALQLIKNSRASYPKSLVLELFEEYDLLCYPDKGAVSKYTEIYSCSHMYGEKVRDQLTGKITKYEIKGQSVKDCRVLIVDDICDGGATFVLLAKELYAHGAKEVNLFVTHGIFSKGLAPLQEAGIKRIFTQDGEACKGIQNQIAYRRL
jgi:ribose-phosphate pyrophosphokinase